MSFDRGFNDFHYGVLPMTEKECVAENLDYDEYLRGFRSAESSVVISHDWEEVA